MSYSFNKKFEAFRQKFSGKKIIIFVSSLVLLLTVIVGSTLAFSTVKFKPIINKFAPGEVFPKVVETFNGSKKENVKIQNTGNVSEYVRVALVFTWQNASGEISSTAVKSGDYTLTLSGSTNWKKGTDGYYYYLPKLKVGDYTDVLVNSCVAVSNKAPEGYHLVFDVLSDAVQSEPSSAVKSAWGLNVSSGKLVVS